MPIRDIPFHLTSDNNYRPWLPIKIINPHTGQSQRTIGLVDTGADECTIPADMAGLLGHVLSRGPAKRSKTAGGSVTGYTHTTKIEIYDFQDKLLHTIYDIPVDFLPGLHVPLLGVEHFLDQFDLHISYPKRIFSILKP